MKCVYSIINLNTGKQYIGSTTNFSRRKYNHLSLLRSNSHHSPRLQASFLKHGEDVFKFIVLEECDNLAEREQFYIDKFDSCNRDRGYNISTNSTHPNGVTKRSVLRYSLDGELIAEYESTQAASLALGNKIGGQISYACSGKYRYYHSSIWIYKDEFTSVLLADKLFKANNKRIVSNSTKDKLRQYMLNNPLKITDEYRSKLSLSHKGKIPKNLSSIQKLRKRKVYVYTLDLKFIEEFESVTVCCKKYPGALVALLHPPRKPRKFIFKYEKLNTNEVN